jgi:hypothetical protein
VQLGLWIIIITDLSLANSPYQVLLQIVLDIHVVKFNKLDL